jgi:hypothetical protein
MPGDVGRAADDLQRFAGAGIHLAHVQAVGVGMAFGGQHAATTIFVNGGATGPTSSTSSPAMVRLCDSASVEIFSGWRTCEARIPRIAWRF